MNRSSMAASATRRKVATSAFGVAKARAALGGGGGGGAVVNGEAGGGVGLGVWGGAFDPWGLNPADRAWAALAKPAAALRRLVAAALRAASERCWAVRGIGVTRRRA